MGVGSTSRQSSAVTPFRGDLMRTRTRIYLSALAIALVPAAAGAQSDYPSKPVRLIVGFTPGSATDITARMFAQKFTEAWGVAVAVENLPGAGGTVSSARVAKAAPDGYTLSYAGNGAITIAPSLYSKLGYDPLRAFVPIS